MTVYLWRIGGFFLENLVLFEFFHNICAYPVFLPNWKTLEKKPTKSNKHKGERTSSEHKEHKIRVTMLMTVV